MLGFFYLSYLLREDKREKNLVREGEKYIND